MRCSIKRVHFYFGTCTLHCLHCFRFVSYVLPHPMFNTSSDLVVSPLSSRHSSLTIAYFLVCNLSRLFSFPVPLAKDCCYGSFSVCLHVCVCTCLSLCPGVSLCLSLALLCCCVCLSPSAVPVCAGSLVGVLVEGLAYLHRRDSSSRKWAHRSAVRGNGVLTLHQTLRLALERSAAVGYRMDSIRQPLEEQQRQATRHHTGMMPLQQQQAGEEAEAGHSWLSHHLRHTAQDGRRRGMRIEFYSCFFLGLSFCLAICLFVSPFSLISYLSVVCLPVRPSVCLSVWRYFSLHSYLSALFTYASVCLSHFPCYRFRRYVARKPKRLRFHLADLLATCTPNTLA